MKATLLRKVLADYLTDYVLTEEDAKGVQNALNELDDIMHRAKSYLSNSEDIYFMYFDDADTFMNFRTYDTYGKLYVQHDGEVTFDQYAEAVLQLDCTLSDEILHLGYDIVSDLYYDNEQQGMHKADGTYNYDLDR